jgi:hypothetical protein
MTSAQSSLPQGAHKLHLPVVTSPVAAISITRDPLDKSKYEII